MYAALQINPRRSLEQPYVQRTHKQGHHQQYNNYLFSFLTFPWAVQAISWTNKSPDKKLDPNSLEAKIRNKSDKILLADLKEADLMYSSELNKNGPGPTHQEIYDKLSKHRAKDEPELFWRLSRVTYELYKREKNSDKRKMDLINEAYDFSKMAIELDPSSFGGHKWAAITLNELSSRKGIKEQIKQSYNVRDHMDVSDLNITESK